MLSLSKYEEDDQLCVKTLVARHWHFDKLSTNGYVSRIMGLDTCVPCLRTLPPEPRYRLLNRKTSIGRTDQSQSPGARMLSNDQKNCFDAFGYLVLRNVFRPDEMATIKRESDEIFG